MKAPQLNRTLALLLCSLIAALLLSIRTEAQMSPTENIELEATTTSEHSPGRIGTVRDSIMWGYHEYNNCPDRTLEIAFFTASPNFDTTATGFQSITLDSETSDNVQLSFITPDTPDAVQGRTEKVTVGVAVADRTKDAYADILVENIKGEIKRIPFVYKTEPVKTTPLLLDFEDVSPNMRSGERCLTFTSLMPEGVWLSFASLSMKDPHSRFRIEHISPSPGLGVYLAPGTEIQVCLSLKPDRGGILYQDSLIADLGCTRIAVPVFGSSMKPCLMVDDLDFGTIRIKKNAPTEKTLQLNICNQGGGEIYFDGEEGKEAMTWLTDNFSVSQKNLDALKKLVLGPSECHSIPVVFHTDRTGIYKTTARLWGSTRDCRDTSVWTARVVTGGLTVTGYDWGLRRVVVGSECTKSREEGYEADVEISNNGAADVTISKIEITGEYAGNFSLINAGNNIGAVIKPGEKITQKIRFEPGIEQVLAATFQVVDDNDDTVTSMLLGIGLDAHIEVPDIDFGENQYSSSSPISIERMLAVQVVHTLPTTITDLKIVGSDAEEFRIDTEAPGFTMPTVENPLMIPPGQVVNIPVRFEPVSPGTKDARLYVVGDHSYCDDSIAVLHGVAVGTSSVAGTQSHNGLTLWPSEPNPVRDQAALRFRVPAAGRVIVTMFDASGTAVETLLDEQLEEGEHRIRWDAASCSAGLYYCRISCRDGSVSVPVVLVR